ncbi:hypothetical protein [Mycolicibacterium fortuitum]|uniref:Lipoprotein n=2 Tax=Mycolicibacterium fortuitum TaxID=1766 RepID=A0AAE4VIQ3_MYCFO|nr:hypothetical protein [Mycolicibacterium fortuitum]MCV7144233.1 hypothetical protein [Mycolicibacterium fortuitum]MDV7195768.1 hypothetical protein [Mycolicibacterium fortuitum]MDV7209462.1 hypothetical protein [Mycolicibacterium fortuitum]MDV7231315.1 hypothetical protein [Mycolicibacterium fortuitum]MDV7262837.1 hypothetical protein [Mycolicibacterium fortuitum]
MDHITIIIVTAILAPCATAAFMVAQTGSTDGIAEILRTVAEIVQALATIFSDGT